MDTRWWDGENWAGRQSVAVTAQKLPPLGPHFAQLGDLVGRLLLANAALSVLMLAVERLVHLEIVYRALAVVVFGLLLVTSVAWCAWQWRMAVSAPERLRRRPGAHIGAWFIPVANLWLPIQNMHELWYIYEPDDDGDGRRATDLVVPWWTCWLVSAVLGIVGLRTLLRGGMPESYLGIAWALAAVLAWLVVRRLSWRALLYHANLD
jgi:Domain of unknown function (DUF4328)